MDLVIPAARNTELIAKLCCCTFVHAMTDNTICGASSVDGNMLRMAAAGLTASISHRIGFAGVSNIRRLRNKGSGWLHAGIGYLQAVQHRPHVPVSRRI